MERTRTGFKVRVLAALWLLMLPVLRSVAAQHKPSPPPPAAPPTPVRLAVLVSGGGTNLLALLDALAESGVARVARVVSSRADAGALERARQRGVPATVLSDPADAAEVITSLGDANLVVL